MNKYNLEKLQEEVIISRGLYPKYIAIMLFATIFTPDRNIWTESFRFIVSTIGFLPLLVITIKYKRMRTMEQSRILKQHVIAWGVIFLSCLYSMMREILKI